MKKVFVAAILFAIVTVFAFGQETVSGNFKITKNGHFIGMGYTRVVANLSDQTQVIFKCDTADWIGVILYKNKSAMLAVISYQTQDTKYSTKGFWKADSRRELTVVDTNTNDVYHFSF